MNDRDMMYGGYYQNIPGNVQYGNFGFQGMPGTLLGVNMIPNTINSYQTPTIIDLNGNTTNPLIEINTKLNNLENRVRLLEQKIGITDSFKDDNSMYMI